MIAALLIGLVGAAVHYLSYHALITQWLWSRYPRPLEALLSCSACTGTWVGLGMGCYFAGRGEGLLGVAPHDPFLFVASAAVGMIATPLVSFAHLGALRAGHGAEE